MNKSQNYEEDKRRCKGQNTREALINAALHLFGERGFDGTSTRALAQAAGCNIGLITFHFHSKQGLYLAARERLKNHLYECIHPITEKFLQIASLPTDEASFISAMEAELQNILKSLLEYSSNQEYFLLLRRSLRAEDMESKKLYEEVFLPLYQVLEKMLNTFRPRCKKENSLRAFLAIDTVISILRDYPSIYAATGYSANAQEDSSILAKILWNILWNNSPDTDSFLTRKQQC